MQYTKEHLSELEKMIIESTNIRKTKSQIQESKRELTFQLEDFLNYVTDCICILDEDGKIVMINEVWLNKLGYTIDELRGREIYKLIHPQDIVQTKEEIDVNIYQKGGVRGVINRCYMKDKSYRWMAWNGVPIEVGGRYFIIGIGRDISREKETANRRLELQRVLEREKYKNMFFSTLSHEFKTPLNIILSITQLFKERWKLQEENEEEEQIGRYVSLISRNAYKTLKVANNLIDLIKLDTQMEKVSYALYNIVEVVEEITMEVAEYIISKDLTIVFDTEVEEKVAWCDATTIERVLLNLLSNAIKYSPLGGEILVSIKEYEDCVSISVRDQGPGIIQGENIVLDTDQIIWGNRSSGLGLKLVSQMINQYGGKLFIYNNQGTEVVFTVPIRKEDQEKQYMHRENLREIHKEKCNVELCDI